MTKPTHAKSTRSGRVYTHPVSGEKWPSITTVIGCLDKPALPRWAAKAAAEYASKSWDALSALGADERIALIKGAPWRESDRAANLGSAVHDAVDHWCKSEPMPEWAPGVEPFMEQFVDFLEVREPEFVENEFTVINRTVGYAGTGDFLAVIGGRLTCVDVKTGNAVYPEVAMQLAALAKAEAILRPDGTEAPLPPAEVLGVLHLRPKSWALVPVVPHDASFTAFCGLLEAWRWRDGVAESVLGARLTVPGDAA